MNILDNNVDTILAEAGLSLSEREVYLAGSQTGMTSAELLAKLNMPRPTLMAALKSLRDCGLCETRRRDGRSLYYAMQPPRALKPYLAKRARSIDAVLDQLDELDIAAPTTIGVNEVNGQAGVMDLLELALRCKSRQWQIIAPKNNALAHLPKDYIAYFKKTRSERQIVSESLWEAKVAGNRVSLNDVLMRKPRYVPADISQKIPSVMLAFDDSLLVIEGTKQPSAVLLRSPAIVETFQLIFEMAWRSAR
ncbi:MAG TPA: helix-turn-helix domain-containing protein [Candidatus Saccharimonadales bacterium]|nr:helix-turn-helix domain-containing protein [Candidatus Saccharimonadales bacterium]